MSKPIKGVVYDWTGGNEREILQDWVKPGAWCRWWGMFGAPWDCGTEGAWIGEIVEVRPKEYKHEYDKVVVQCPGDDLTDKPVIINADRIEFMELPSFEALHQYVHAYLNWVNGVKSTNYKFTGTKWEAAHKL